MTILSRYTNTPPKQPYTNFTNTAFSITTPKNHLTNTFSSFFKNYPIKKQFDYCSQGLILVNGYNNDTSKPFRLHVVDEFMEEQIKYYEAKLKYEIDSWDLNDKLNNKEKIMVLDTRSPEAFKQEHIPGAINIPHRNMNAQNTAYLDKNIFYVTYCDGIGCNASTKGALKMTQLGFCVKELLGGIDWWKRDGYPTNGIESSDKDKIACGC